MLFYKNWIHICFIFFVSFYLHSQDHTNFKHLNINYNGIDIYADQCVQDNQGKIWFSHSNGVLQYDGYDFSLISTKSIFKLSTQDKLSKIVKDAKGNIWLLSTSGKISNYVKDRKFNNIPVESDGRVDRMFSIAGEIFFASNSGEIFHYSNSKVKKILTLPNVDNNFRKIESLALSKSNDLYIGTTSGNIFTYSLIKEELGKLEGAFSNYHGGIQLVIDKNENLWIGTETLGLYAYNTKTEEFFQDNIFKNSGINLSKELFITLYCDSKGFIWAGTDGSGLYQINPKTEHITSYIANPNNKYSLGSNTIIDLH